MRCADSSLLFGIRWLASGRRGSQYGPCPDMPCEVRGSYLHDPVSRTASTRALSGRGPTERGLYPFNAAA
jgi:hypothetical protein